jgi:hypothetical protein
VTSCSRGGVLEEVAARAGADRAGSAEAIPLADASLDAVAAAHPITGSTMAPPTPKSCVCFVPAVVFAPLSNMRGESTAAHGPTECLGGRGGDGCRRWDQVAEDHSVPLDDDSR